MPANDRHWSDDEEFGALDERVVPLKEDLGEDWDVDDVLDTTDVRREDPDEWLGVRPEPEWLLRTEYEEEDLGPLRSGKEAQVSVVRRTALEGGGSCLLAV